MNAGNPEEKPEIRPSDFDEILSALMEQSKAAREEYRRSHIQPERFFELATARQNISEREQEHIDQCPKCNELLQRWRKPRSKSAVLAPLISVEDVSIQSTYTNAARSSSELTLLSKSDDFILRRGWNGDCNVLDIQRRSGNPALLKIKFTSSAAGAVCMTRFACTSNATTPSGQKLPNTDVRVPFPNDLRSARLGIRVEEVASYEQLSEVTDWETAITNSLREYRNMVSPEEAADYLTRFKQSLQFFLNDQDKVASLTSASANAECDDDDSERISSS